MLNLLDFHDDSHIVVVKVVKEAYEASRILFDSVNRKKMAIAAVKEVARGGGSVEQLREMIEALWAGSSGRLVSSAVYLRIEF